MLNRVMPEKIYCGLDIGSKKIKACVLKAKEAGHIEILGAYEQKTYGFRDGAVTNLAELTECIHDTVEKLTEKVNIKIKDVILGIPGSLIDCRQTNTLIPLVDRGSKMITRRDVRKINNQARLLGVQMEEEVLHDLPQIYQVDDGDEALNPVGLYGRKLGVQSLMLVCQVNRIRNLTKAVHQAGLDIKNMFFSSLVCADIVLEDHDKKEGCVLIDIGSTGTNMLFFHKGGLKDFKKIDVGGDMFTKNIAEGLNLSFDLAEEIKKSYAVATTTDLYPDEEILVKRDSAYMPIKRERIYHAIEPVLDAFVTGIKTAVQDSVVSEQLNRGVKMVGGGSMMPGLIERVSEQTNLSVGLSRLNVVMKKSLSSSATFAAAIGLAKNGFQNSVAYSIQTNGHSHWVKKATEKIKEIYQEYF